MKAQWIFLIVSAVLLLILAEHQSRAMSTGHHRNQLKGKTKQQKISCPADIRPDKVTSSVPIKTAMRSSP